MSHTFFKSKNILITGGTGSFGQAFARKLLTEDECNKVIIMSRDEWKQWEMKKSDPIFNHSKIRYFLGDVRDSKRLERAFNEVHFIVHAAALKQVPAAEYNPSEFVLTNVIGGMNVADAAIDCGVEKVIFLSTDKAVNPINLYGATKLCADKLVVAANAYVGARGYPKFSVVRYGNVSGSRGSIVPLWRSMIAQGAKSLPLTDERMTRFWITLEQAVEFVENRFQDMCGEEIFVPKSPSIHLTDLAKAIAPDYPHEYIGIRPGEKLHESLVSIEDARHTIEREDYFLILPEKVLDEPKKYKMFLEKQKGQLLPEGFAYTSDTNKDWLNVEQIREVIKE